MLEFLTQLVEPYIEQYGLSAIFATMFLESALVPIPSEVVVPLGGFLAHSGYFSFWSLVIWTSVANLLGSILSYFVGTKMKWIHKINFLEEHVKMSNSFFKKHGLKAIFFARMMPAIRTFISLPAGLADVPFWEFCALTFLGALPWNFTLASLGWVLGKNWELVHAYGKLLTLLVLAGLPIAYLAYVRYEKAIEEGEI